MNQGLLSDASVVDSGEIAARVGPTSRAPPYPLTGHPSAPPTSPPPTTLSCLFLCQASRLRHAIRRSTTPNRISNFANHLPSKEQIRPAKLSRVARARTSAAMSRPRADCFCTLAHHVNAERRRLCAASRTCEKRDQRSRRERERPQNRVCVCVSASVCV